MTIYTDKQRRNGAAIGGGMVPGPESNPSVSDAAREEIASTARLQAAAVNDPALNGDDSKARLAT